MGKRAVILAGGKGSRLGPYTTVLPKPLLPVGDRAILDVVIRQLQWCGFSDLTLAVGYLGHLVRAVFGDGAAHGVSIRYCEEDEPLGTAGCLPQIEDLDETFLMMNGDILTTLDYRELFRLHEEAGNAFTIATHSRVVDIDYGVLHLDGARGETRHVIGYEEKPQLCYTVSMGVYIAEPEVIDYVAPDEQLDVPDLVRRLLAGGEHVGAYPYDGFWLDIGRHDDYEQAIEHYDDMKPLLMRDLPGLPIP